MYKKRLVSDIDPPRPVTCNDRQAMDIGSN